MPSGDYPSEYTGPQIDVLLGKVSDNESDITSLKSRMSSAELALGTKADATSVTNLSSQVSGITVKIPSEASSSNKLADKAYVNSALSGKVDKVGGMGLSSNDYTSEEKTKLGALPTNAQLSAQLSGKQATLVSGTNIKTINNESILGSGNITAGDPNAVKYVAQTLTASQKEQARENIGAASAGDITGQYYGFYTSSSSLPTGMSIAGYAFVGSSEPFAVWNYNGSTWSDSGATVNAIQGEPGVGFASVSAPSTPDGTMLITLTNGDTITIDMNHNHPAYPKYVYLTSESQMPASPESDTLYLILESQS